MGPWLLKSVYLFMLPSIEKNQHLFSNIWFSGDPKLYNSKNRNHLMTGLFEDLILSGKNHLKIRLIEDQISNGTSHLKNRLFVPFENRTFYPVFRSHSKTGPLDNCRISDHWILTLFRCYMNNWLLRPVSRSYKISYFEESVIQMSKIQLPYALVNFRCDHTLRLRLKIFSYKKRSKKLRVRREFGLR